jgi:hypothetical protein
MLFPDKLEINSLNAIYCKGHIFGYQSIVIARRNISSVSIGAGIFFADIVIETIGGKRVTASGFRKTDAKKIVRLLT